MSVIDWIDDSRAQIREHGPRAGLAKSTSEFAWGLHSRLRPVHWLTPNYRTVTLAGHDLRIRQRTVAEWDHLRAIHNERSTIEEFVGTVDSDSVVWDIGANVGSWALPAAAVGADVIAFEPMPSNQAAIRENLDMNGLDATIVGCALSDSTGVETMVRDDRSTAGAGRSSLQSDWRDGEEMSVLTLAGDGIDLPNPDVMKVDVEGAELEVLRGLEDRLSGTRRLFVELHGLVDEDVSTFVKRAGFEVVQTPAETGCDILEVKRDI